MTVTTRAPGLTDHLRQSTSSRLVGQLRSAAGPKPWCCESRGSNSVRCRYPARNMEPDRGDHGCHEREGGESIEAAGEAARRVSGPAHDGRTEEAAEIAERIDTGDARGS